MDKEKDNKLFSEFPPISKQEWEALITKDLKGADYEKKLVWKTYEGFNVQPYYMQEDLLNLPFLDELLSQQANNLVNGAANNWEIRQDIACKNALRANNKAVEVIHKGADAVSFNVSAIESLNDLETLLNGIDLTKTAVYFTGSSSYPKFAHIFAEYLKKNSIDASLVKGALNFDSLSWLLLHGSFYSSHENEMAEAKMLFTSLEKIEHFKLLTINGHYFHNAGASAVQELAFSMASAMEYLSALTDKGLNIDQIAPKIMFSFALGSSYFMEIAKIRAARILWNKIITLYNGNAQSKKTFIHCSNSEWNKTVYDPYVNMLRTTTETMSGAIGGADSMTVLPFDTSFKKSDDFSERIARNQQLILKSEAYLDKVYDPSAGSYYIENITNSLVCHAWDLMKTIEEKGGYINCIKSGFVYEQIETLAHKKIADIASRRKVLVGTNNYPNINENVLDKIEPNSKTDHIAKLSLKRAALDFEALRLSTEDFEKRTGKRPSVLLFKIGNPAMRTARAMFITNFFAVAGYTIIDEKPFDVLQEGIDKIKQLQPTITVLCSSDEEYITVGIEAVSLIKQNGSNTKIIVAGYPSETIEQLKNAGVDDFIHIKLNILETLRKYNTMFGINL